MTALRIVRLGLIALAALGLSAGAQAVDFIRNGNFDSIGQPRSRQISGDGPHEQYLPAWTNGAYYDADSGRYFAGYNFYVTGGTADLDLGNPGNSGAAIQTNNFGLLAIAGPGNGVYNGFVGSPTGGTIVMADALFRAAPISQTIRGLIAGETYRLQFDWSGGQQTGYGGANTEWWQVDFGDQRQFTYSVPIGPQGFTGWQHADMQFVAADSTQLLSFLARAVPGGQPPMLMLDGVRLDGPRAVPEPGSWAMMVAGFFATGAVLRRTRRRRALAA